MVKNAHFSRHFGENCKKTTRKRSFFFKLNNFLRILYVSFPYFYHFDWSEVFSAISEQIPQQNKPKKDIFKAKKLLFWRKLWKNDAKKQFFRGKKISAHFLCFLLCFHHFDGSEVSSAFSAQIPQNVPFMRQKTYFFGKNCEKTTRKSSFFSNKKLFGTFSMISSMFLPLWVIWGEETEYSKR